MLETGTFGLPRLSFTQLGSDNTFEAAPAVLDKKAIQPLFSMGMWGVFGIGTMCKNLGYQYFLIGHIFKDDKMLGYGILDKQLLRESASELEHLQRPFYAKF